MVFNDKRKRIGVVDDMVIAPDKGLLPGSAYEKGAALQRPFLPWIAENFNCDQPPEASAAEGAMYTVTPWSMAPCGAI